MYMYMYVLASRWLMREVMIGSLLQAQYERLVRDNDILNQRLTKAQQDYENQLMNRSAIRLGARPTHHMARVLN